MGTKSDPAPNDCYAKAEPHEPMFVLLARDPAAPALVRQWAKQAEASGEHAVEKTNEARTCADAMEEWYRDNRDAQRMFEDDSVMHPLRHIGRIVTYAAAIIAVLVLVYVWPTR